MGLDFAILADDGRPTHSVTLNPDQHFRLFGVPDTALPPLLTRLSDFYEDADYSEVEMPKLELELNQLRLRLSRDVDKAVINSLIELVHQAKLQRRGLSVLAD